MTLNYCDHIPRADLDHHPAHQRGNVRRPVHVEAKSQVKLLSRSDRIASDKIASVILSALLVFAGVALLISAQLKGNRHHAVLGTGCFLVALAIFVILQTVE
jgi:hypothetical protein